MALIASFLSAASAARSLRACVVRSARFNHELHRSGPFPRRACIDWPGEDDDACEVRTAGWLAYGHPETLEAIHVAEHVLRSPHRLAALLEAAGEQVLRDASAILARRLAGE